MIQAIFEFLRGSSFRQAMAHQAGLRDESRRHLLRNATGFQENVARSVTGQDVVLGIHRAGRREVLSHIPLVDLHVHHLVQGRTSCGKSRYVESILVQLMQRPADAGVVVIDGKGELFHRMHLWVAALASTMKQARRREFLPRIVLLDPFDRSSVMPLNFCSAAGVGPADLSAEDLMSGLRRLFADDKLTLRMELLLRSTLIALIEGGSGDRDLSLLEAGDLLTNAAFRERVLLRVRNEEVRVYFRRDFPHETRGTVEAVKARLASLFASEHLRLCFGAREGIRFDDAIASAKVVLVNLGKSPQATEKAREVVGTLVLTAFVRAVFSRPMNHGQRILAVMDEFQTFVVPGLLEQLLTEARAYRCFVTAICQQLGAQVGSRALREILLNNARFVSLFSSNEEDARAIGRAMFRPTGCLPRPQHPFSSEPQRFLSEAEEIEHHIRRVPSLPRRSFWFWDKESPFGAQLMVTCTVKEPHEFAGMSEQELGRVLEAIRPFCGQAGADRETVQKSVGAKRDAWGLGEVLQEESARSPITRRALVAALEAHLGSGDSDESSNVKTRRSNP